MTNTIRERGYTMKYLRLTAISGVLLLMAAAALFGNTITVTTTITAAIGTASNTSNRTK